MDYDFPSEGSERLASESSNSGDCGETKGEHDKPDKSCGGWKGSRATAVVALILVLILFILMWVGVFGGMTEHQRPHSRIARFFSNGSIGGMLFALVIIFIIFAIMVWVVYDNPSWGVWLSALIILIFIILVICAIVGASGCWGDKKDGHKGDRDSKSDP